MKEHIRSSSGTENKFISNPNELFKMAKFKNVAPRTNTHNGSRSALTTHRKSGSAVNQ